MSRINLISNWATITLASLFVAVSYELRSTGVFSGLPSIVVAVIAFAVGAGAARIIVAWLLGLRRIRRWIMGDSWVEGYWLVQTEGDIEEQNPLAQPAVLYLEHKLKRGALKAVTTRYSADGIISIGNSEIAFLREDQERIQYLNYFSLSYEDTNGRYGMAVSEFSKNSHLPSSPNILQGRITLEGDGLVRRQTGTRIELDTVLKLAKEYGEVEWIKQVLLNDAEGMLSTVLTCPINTQTEQSNGVVT